MFYLFWCFMRMLIISSLMLILTMTVFSKKVACTPAVVVRVMGDWETRAAILTRISITVVVHCGYVLSDQHHIHYVYLQHLLEIVNYLIVICHFYVAHYILILKSAKCIHFGEAYSFSVFLFYYH